MIFELERVVEICQENYDIVQVLQEPNYSIVKCSYMCLHSNIESLLYYVNVYRTNIIVHVIETGTELEFKTVQEFQFWIEQ